MRRSRQDNESLEIRVIIALGIIRLGVLNSRVNMVVVFIATIPMLGSSVSFRVAQLNRLKAA